MTKKFLVAAALLAFLAFAIPIEHKYDKLFRHFSLTLIPHDLTVSPNYDKKIYFYVSDLITLALLSIGLFWFRIPVKRFFGNPLWILFFCAIISLSTSPFSHYAVPYTRLLQLLTPILLFSFLSSAFSEEERPKITRLILFAIVTAGLFQTVIAITQYFHNGPLGLRLLGETTECSHIYVSDKTRWTLDRFFDFALPTIQKIRAAGTLPHANVLGGFLFLSILSTYALAVQAKRPFLSFTLPIQFFALCLSYSRSAIFAWLLGSLIWFGWMFFQNGLKNRRIRWLALLMILSAAGSWALLYNQFINRGGIVNYNTIAQKSDRVRIYHQNLSLEIIKQTPFFGLGPSQFSEGASAYFPNNLDPQIRSTAPHNIFLFLACETGLFSVAAFLSFIVLLLWKAIRAPVTVETAMLTAALAGFLLIGCCDFYPILFQQGKLMFFLIGGLLASHVWTQAIRLGNEGGDLVS